MLGFHVTVYRQVDGGASPATFETVAGSALANWETGLFGLDWLDDLVKEGKAINLGVQCLAGRYTAKAEHVLPPLIEKPPDNWRWPTTIDRAAAAACRPDEWLMIEAWDLS